MGAARSRVWLLLEAMDSIHYPGPVLLWSYGRNHWSHGLTAFVASADVAFVVTHHLVRLVTVMLAAPFVARRARG
jgi:hypothetical protein